METNAMILLDNSIYYDIPKTGGSWVSEGLVLHLGGDFLEGSSHYPPTGDEDLITFTFIRHPVDWFRSYFASMLDKQMGVENNFTEFIKKSYSGEENYFGFGKFTSYSDLVKPFLVCDYIGKTEHLKKDLEEALSLAGEGFDRGELIERKKVNVSQSEVNITDEARKIILKNEKDFINKYYNED